MGAAPSKIALQLQTYFGPSTCSPQALRNNQSPLGFGFGGLRPSAIADLAKSAWMQPDGARLAPRRVGLSVGGNGRLHVVECGHHARAKRQFAGLAALSFFCEADYHPLPVGSSAPRRWHISPRRAPTDIAMESQAMACVSCTRASVGDQEEAISRWRSGSRWARMQSKPRPRCLTVHSVMSGSSSVG